MEDSTFECIDIELDSNEGSIKRHKTFKKGDFASRYTKGKVRLSIYLFVTALCLISVKFVFFACELLCKSSLWLDGFITA